MRTMPACGPTRDLRSHIVKRMSVTSRRDAVASRTKGGSDARGRSCGVGTAILIGAWFAGIARADQAALASGRCSALCGCSRKTRLLLSRSAAVILFEYERVSGIRTAL